MNVIVLAIVLLYDGHKAVEISFQINSPQVAAVPYNNIIGIDTCLCS